MNSIGIILCYFLIAVVSIFSILFIGYTLLYRDVQDIVASKIYRRIYFTQDMIIDLKFFSGKKPKISVYRYGTNTIVTFYYFYDLTSSRYFKKHYVGSIKIQDIRNWLKIAISQCQDHVIEQRKQYQKQNNGMYLVELL